MVIFILKDIGKRIINLREAKNWSQRELARRVNLNFSVMNRIESGERPIKDHELIDLSTALDVTADYLLGKTNQKHNSDDNKKAALMEEMARRYPDAEIMFDNLAGMTYEQLKEVDDFIRFKLQKKD